ncbi:MAG: alpha/beta hydrolase [Caulobacter sp.]|nr:alpha/beta hydrolase [Caulobacter sp.]
MHASVLAGLTLAAVLATAAPQGPPPPLPPGQLGDGVITFPMQLDDHGALYGSLTEPTDPRPNAPVALFLVGSGPTDHNGDNPMGVKGSPYRRLIEALGGQGVITLSVDKRGMFRSAGAAADGNRVTVEDLAADAHAWIADLKWRTGAKCIWLIGHSEGVLVALITAQDPKDICGVVSISGPGRRLSDVIRQQLKDNPANAPLLPDALAALDALEAGKDVDSTNFHPALQPLFNPKVQPFLKVMFRYDPAALAHAYKGPLLILQGTTDLQISLDDARRLEAAHPGATLVTLPGVNHVLRTAPLDRAANMASYGDENAPLAPGVAEPIAAFMKAHKPR